MITAIIQARFGSTRLPGKVLKEISGKTALELMIERVRRSDVSDIILATSIQAQDDAVADLAGKAGVTVFRGSEEDVLDRYYQAAKKFGAAHIVRLTGDCPLMDSEIIDKAAGFYLENLQRFDYVSNVRPPTYPDGMDVEVFSFSALEKSWKEAKLPSEREHVTAYIGNHPEIFRIGNIENNEDLSHIRLTLDNLEDLAVIKAVFRELYPKNRNFTLTDILSLYKNCPEIFSTNQTIKRNEGYAKSLVIDKEV